MKMYDLCLRNIASVAFVYFFVIIFMQELEVVINMINVKSQWMKKPSELIRG